MNCGAIEFIDRLIDEGRVAPGEFRKIHVHILTGAEAMLALGASSKVNTEWAFLLYLRDLGRAAADAWIATHFDDINARSTVDIGALFGGYGTPLDPVR